jgi:hypothetical protein
VAFRKDGIRVYYRLERERLDRFVPQFFQVHCLSRCHDTE